MFSVRLINGQTLPMTRSQLEEFCWDHGINFSVVEKAISALKNNPSEIEICGMWISAV